MNKPIFLFTNYSNNEIGGMEVHQQAFIKYFKYINSNFYIVILKENIKIYKNDQYLKDYSSLKNFIDFINENFEEAIFFFNNLSWIKEIPILRQSVKINAKYIIRSGGNDIIRAPYDNDEIPLNERQNIIVEIINKNIDFLIVNSDYSYNRNIKLGINPKLMKKIRGGVDYDLIHHLILNKSFNRNSFDIINKTSNKKILSIICRLVDFKGIIQFLDYYAKIKHNNYFLLIAGSGNLSDVIRNKLLNTLSEQDYLFSGPIPHSKALEIISISDVVINPSIEVKRYYGKNYYIHTETMGRTMLEAICCNIPILASTAGATNEIFAENQNIGLCVSDWNNLEKNLDYLIKVKFQSKVIDYSWNLVFSKYIEIF